MPDRRTLSASQLETFLLCERRWAFQKIERLESPPSKYQQFGLDLHETLEHWLKFATPIPIDSMVGKVALTGIPLLPLPKTPGLRIEEASAVRSSVVDYFVKADLMAPQGWDMSDGGVPIVVDYKSTGNQAWAKTPEELADNIQANIYAAEAMVRYETDVAELRWIYYHRSERPKPAKLVQLRLTKAHVEKQFDRLDEISSRILERYDTTEKALDLPPTLSACEAFGAPCPFQDRCAVSAKERIRSAMAQETLSERRERLKREAEETAKGYGAGPTVGGGTDTNVQTPGEVRIPSIPTQGNAVAPGSGAGAMARLVAAQKGNGAAVNPPDLTQASPAPLHQAIVNGFQQALDAVGGIGQVEGSLLDEKPIQTSQAENPSHPVVAAQVKKARAVKEAVQKGEPAPEGQPERPGFTLYIDCLPAKGGGKVDAFSDWLPSIHAGVKASTGTEHYKLVDYGKGVPTYQQTIKSLFERVTAFQGLTISSRTPEGIDALSTLEGLAARVVRGL